MLPLICFFIACEVRLLLCKIFFTRAAISAACLLLADISNLAPASYGEADRSTERI